MLSRVANSLFWLGRYVERAENYARFIDVNFNLSIDLPQGIEEQWDPLVNATGDRELYQEIYDSKIDRQNAIKFLAFDDRNQNSICSAISIARENARIVREHLPKEAWEVINDTHHYISACHRKKVWRKEDSQECFTTIKQKLQLFNGIAYDTFPRNQGWYFIRLGQFLERADKTSRILDVKYHYLLPSVDMVGSPLDFLHWAALLKSVSAFNAYRRNNGKIDPTAIVDYLVLSRTFPRSILYCLLMAEDCLHEISQAKRGYTNAAEKALGSLRSDLEFADVNDVFDYGLHEYLDALQGRLNKISAEIHDQYFQIQPNFAQQSQSQS